MCVQLEKSEQASSLALLRLFSTGVWQDYTGYLGQYLCTARVLDGKSTLESSLTSSDLVYLIVHSEQQPLSSTDVSADIEAQAAHRRVNSDTHEGANAFCCRYCMMQVRTVKYLWHVDGKWRRC